MLRPWKKKSVAVRKWRSRAWSIDPKVTKLTIIKTEAEKIEDIDTADFNLNFNFNFSKLLKNFPVFQGHHRHRTKLVASALTAKEPILEMPHQL